MSDPSPLDPLAGISGKLGELTDEKLLEVLHRLAKIPTSAVVPPLLDEVRPRLRQLRPMRPLSLLRLLCRPFEDLLSDAVPVPPDRVPRAIIEPTWRLLIGRDDAQYRQFRAEIERLTPDEPERVDALAERIWRWGAAVFTSVLATSEAPPHLALIRDVLDAGPEIEAFKRAVPGRPVATLGAFEAPHLEAGLQRLASRGLAADSYLIVIAARLANPGELLAFRHAPGAQVADSTLARLAEFSTVEIVQRGGIFAHETAEASPNDIARDADRLTQAIALVRGTLDPAQRAPFEARIAPVVAAVRTALTERILRDAPDISAMVLMEGSSEEMLVAAENHARALGRMRGAASAVGLDAQTGRAITELRQRFEAQIVDQLRRALTPSARSGAERAVHRAIRFVELIDGPQRARELFADARQRLRPRPVAATTGPSPNRL
jgi:hypothetical protein